jgi:hypothetical protein
MDNEWWSDENFVRAWWYDYDKLVVGGQGLHFIATAGIVMHTSYPS